MYFFLKLYIIMSLIKIIGGRINNKPILAKELNNSNLEYDFFKNTLINFGMVS